MDLVEFVDFADFMVSLDSGAFLDSDAFCWILCRSWTLWPQGQRVVLWDTHTVGSAEIFFTEVVARFGIPCCRHFCSHGPVFSSTFRF